ncbi:MAG: hypothetical protein NW220_17845 [Leptolyngbyaceae cyanobacterium bins.349]|nr:hypothetical protein [Leptolyngbyaceae cyanobacterium bins.349]
MNRLAALEAQFQQLLQRESVLASGHSGSFIPDVKQTPALASETPSGSKTLSSSAGSPAPEELPTLPDLPNGTALIAAAEQEVVVEAENSVRGETCSVPESLQNREETPPLLAMPIDHTPLAALAQLFFSQNRSDMVSLSEGDLVEQVIWIETSSGKWEPRKWQVIRSKLVTTQEAETERSQATPLLDPEPEIGQLDQKLPQLSQFTTPDPVQTPTNSDANVELLGAETGEVSRSDESFHAKPGVISAVILEQTAQELPQPSPFTPADPSTLLRSPAGTPGGWVMMSNPEETDIGQSSENSELDPKGPDQAAPEPPNQSIVLRLLNQLGTGLRKVGLENFGMNG